MAFNSWWCGPAWLVDPFEHCGNILTFFIFDLLCLKTFDPTFDLLSFESVQYIIYINYIYIIVLCGSVVYLVWWCMSPSHDSHFTFMLPGLMCTFVRATDLFLFSQLGQTGPLHLHCATQLLFQFRFRNRVLLLRS